MEFGHNGCNTRDDILRRDLAELVVRPGTCFAQSGVLLDPYTGESIPFVRGPDTSDAVQIDHVVSLSDAWYKGAREWDDQRRRDFANDPRNLLAVGGKANFDKAFRDATGMAAAQRGVPLRVRRPPGRGEDGLPAVGVGEREAGDGRGAGRLLAERDQTAARRQRVRHRTSCGSAGRRSTSSSSRTTATSRAAGSASGSDRS